MLEDVDGLGDDITASPLRSKTGLRNVAPDPSTTGALRAPGHIRGHRHERCEPFPGRDDRPAGHSCGSRIAFGSFRRLGWPSWLPVSGGSAMDDWEGVQVPELSRLARDRQGVEG